MGTHFPKMRTDKRARIFAMIDNIDQNVGKLTRGLEELGASVGHTHSFHGRQWAEWEAPCCRHVQGMKSHVHEGGYSFSVASALACSPQRRAFPLAQGGRPHRCDTTILGCLWDSLVRGQKWTAEVFPLLDGRPSVWLDRTSFHSVSSRGCSLVRYYHFAARNQRWKLLHASGFGKEGFQGAPSSELYDMQLIL